MDSVPAASRCKLARCFQKTMAAKGVPTAVHYPVPITAQPAYAHLSDTACPASDRAAKRVISLPMSAYLSKDDQDRVIEAVLSSIEPV